MQAGFRPTPQNIFRTDRPFMLDQVIDFSCVEIRAEMLPEVRNRGGISKHVVSQRSVAAGQRLQ
jgi:hypothetical protein